MKPLFLAASIIALAATSALAGDPSTPAFGDSFNVTDKSVDFSKLTRENFYDVLVPLAKEKGNLTFYSYWPPTPLIVFQEKIIPSFEKKYGIKVNYLSVEPDTGLQQLDAAYREHKASPTDAYFSCDLPTNLDEIANVRLVDLLPNAADLNPKLSFSYKGIQHNGSYLPFHGNQTVLAYNSAVVKEMPDTFEGLLEYAKAHPHTVAITTPRSGSGSGFLIGVANAFMTKACVARYLDLSAKESEIDAMFDGPCFEPVWGYLKDLLKVAELTNGNTDTLNLMANGVAQIGTAWEDLTYSFIVGKQLPGTIRVTIPKSGQPGGAEGVFIPSNAQNLAAAMLFVDEMLAPEHQAWKLANFASRSAKTKLDSSLIPAEAQNYLVPGDIYAERPIGRPNPKMQSAAINNFIKHVLEN